MLRFAAVKKIAEELSQMTKFTQQWVDKDGLYNKQIYIPVDTCLWDLLLTRTSFSLPFFPSSFLFRITTILSAPDVDRRIYP